MLLPASALFLDRPMPPARALVDAGAAVALATDFNPGSSFTTSLPLVCSLACTQLHLAPAEALAAVTVNAAHVLGCAADRGRIAPGSAPTSSCSTRPTGATSPTTWQATSSRPSSAAGESLTGANLTTMPSRKQRRRREKDFRHDVRVFEVDEEGNEVPLDPEELRAEREAKQSEGKAAGQREAAAGGRERTPAARAAAAVVEPRVQARRDDGRV